MTSARDDDGESVGPGDWISFSYGIPPIGVRAKIADRNGRLVAIVLGDHKPREVFLNNLRKHVGSWYKDERPGS